MSHKRLLPDDEEGDYSPSKHRAVPTLSVVEDEVTGTVSLQVASGHDQFEAVQNAMVDTLHDASSEYTSDGDDAGSLEDFIIDDTQEASNPKVDRFFGRVRVRSGALPRLIFRNLLYYVVRSTLDKTFSRHVHEVVTVASEEGRAAIEMWDSMGLCAAAAIHAFSLRTSVVVALNETCLMSERLLDANVFDKPCSVCKSTGHALSRCITLFGLGGVDRPVGGAYDGKFMFEDVRALERLQTTPGEEKKRGYRVLCGHVCGEHIRLYQQLVHFWFLTAWRCYNDLRSLTLPPKAVALRILNGDEEQLERKCFAEYVRLTEACENF